MSTLLFKTLLWNIFEVKIIAAFQGSAKTNIAFFIKCILCVCLCIHIETKNAVHCKYLSWKYYSLELNKFMFILIPH